MNLRVLPTVLLASVLAIVSVGCNSAPGKPKPGLTEEAIRPDQVADFNTLYSQNCAACHGEYGRNGAAISLANPLYLSFAGPDNLQRIVSNGVPGTMMPGFAKSAGGMLTDQQINILIHGMVQNWSKPLLLNGQDLPKYAVSLPANTARGQEAFGASCASCHGADGTGSSSKWKLGSLVDAAYLSLISDQGLRSIVVAGKQEQGMPDYRSHSGHALTDQEITDIVAWLASHRTATPGQIYQQHP